MILGLTIPLISTPQTVEAGYYYYGTYASYYDGNFHYHEAGYGTDGLWYPAGNYSWINGQWYLQGYGFGAGVAKKVDYTPDWKKQLLNIAANRDKVEGRLRENALDQQHFLQAAEALGLKGNFNWSNYGQHPGFPGYGAGGYGAGLGSIGLGSYGATSDTVYGYTYNTIKDVYGDTNLAALYQQASRLAENAQNLGGQATQGFQDAVAKEGDNRSRVAEILAKAQAAKVALDAANLPPQSHTETKSSTVVVTPTAPVGTPNPAPSPNLSGWAEVASNRCASCHSDKTQGGPKGKFNIVDYPKLAPEQKAKVLERIFTEDLGRVMPRSADGKGAPLSAQEKVKFVGG